MEIVGGFMVMMSIISLFLAVVWLIMPFVVFAIKGKQDRALELLESMEARMAAIEARLQPIGEERDRGGSGEASAAPADDGAPVEDSLKPNDPARDKKGQDASPAV